MRTAELFEMSIAQFSFSFSAMSRTERQERDADMAERVLAENRAKKRQAEAEAAEVAAKNIRPGDPGWVPRARVPMPDTREYVVRPDWQSSYDMSKEKKKVVTLLEKHKRKFAEKSRDLKTQQAIKISIEGKNMTL